MFHQVLLYCMCVVPWVTDSVLQPTLSTSLTCNCCDLCSCGVCKTEPVAVHCRPMLINGRRLWRLRLRVLSCYLLLIIVCSWLALCLYGALCTPNPWYKVGMAAPVRSSLLTRQEDDRLFVERPLVLLTLSYHAAPIYDLMDQLQPLGVQFIERGINAYACQYFNSCRRHDPLKVNH